MTRVLHTADTHVGYRQYHSPERRRDFVEAFAALVDDAVESEVDAVVHAGDLFHDSRPDLRDLLGTLDVLRRLDDAGIPFLAVVGNHEATRREQWLDLFERLGLAVRLDESPHVVGDVALYGLDHVPPSRRDDLEYAFDPSDAPHAALVAHGLFTPFAHADWETEAVLDASPVDFDALLLGDNHAPGTERVDDAWVTYPGSTERASASEREPRGYNLVDFDDGVEISRRTLATRPFVFVDADLGPDEGVERVRERVRQHDLTDAVVIVAVEGDGDPVPPARIEEAALDEGALIARVTDRREVEDEAVEADVRFADPDAAVRERIAEMGLSAAARDVDETVRASGVAYSNVRETARRRVEERLEEGSDAFRRADGGGTANGDEEGYADDGDGDDPIPDAAETGDGTDGGDDGGPPESDGAPADGAAADGDADARDGEGDAADRTADDADGQASMEEYL
ncbi:MAG: DNA double-strand break repair protein Mre11 [Haloferacaceae archaeon]